MTRVNLHYATVFYKQRSSPAPLPPLSSVRAPTFRVNIFLYELHFSVSWSPSRVTGFGKMASLKEPPFEKALADLENIIEKLESDDLTLDTALSHFEKGVALMRSCENHLKSAEGKLKELLQGEDGELVEKILGNTADALSRDNAHDA